ncbi:hypothetical protein E2C01_065233 [Portunus trituberculatus]|uniref:Uncharacterized protein n=1 Tax=Portunus trituberculatus TaxID=210409 RepID=A0A5B7HP15_PORTR|nr:hypothetical protein [Portunus trituberculatus]
MLAEARAAKGLQRPAFLQQCHGCQHRDRSTLRSGATSEPQTLYCNPSIKPKQRPGRLQEDYSVSPKDHTAFRITIKL